MGSDTIIRTVYAWDVVERVVTMLEHITGDLERGEHARMRIYAAERRIEWLVNGIQPTERRVRECKKGTASSARAS